MLMVKLIPLQFKLIQEDISSNLTVIVITVSLMNWHVDI